MRWPCCLFIPPIKNAWSSVYESWYVYHGTWPHLNGVLHKSLPSVCVSVYPHIVARHRLGKDVPAASNKRNSRIIVGGVVFSAVRAISRESMLLFLPRTSWFYLMFRTLSNDYCRYISTDQSPVFVFLHWSRASTLASVVQLSYHRTMTHVLPACVTRLSASSWFISDWSNMSFLPWKMTEWVIMAQLSLSSSVRFGPILYSFTFLIPNLHRVYPLPLQSCSNSWSAV
jgi:hypothetical protein